MPQPRPPSPCQAVAAECILAQRRSSPVHEGDVLAGKYRVEKVLGEGGMGVVVAAHHLQLDERVALKFLLPAALGDPEAVARFEREARAAVKIKSEHVARVTDVGTLENGAPYMVMEYLEGGDLSAWVSERGALPVEQAVEFVLQACEAIAEAHALGIVHRDLKPANLFCVRRADDLLSVKVLDFGISKVIATSGSGSEMGMTKTASIMGSPLYMSPEQMHSAKSVDARTDLWALGVILYEPVTAKVPFDGESLPAVVLNVTSRPPPPLRDLRPDAPEGLEAVILRCLEKDLEKRYRNVAELCVALAEFGPKRARGSVERVARVIQAAGLSASALALPPSSGTPEAAIDPPAQAGTVASWGQTAPGAGRRKALAGVVAVVVLTGLAVVAGAVVLGRRPAPVATDANADARGIVPPAASAAVQPAASASDAAPIVAPSASAPAPATSVVPVSSAKPVSRVQPAAPVRAVPVPPAGKSHAYDHL